MPAWVCALWQKATANYHRRITGAKGPQPGITTNIGQERWEVAAQTQGRARRGVVHRAEIVQRVQGKSTM